MGLLAVEEEERIRLAEEGDSRADQVDHLARKTGYLQERLHLEEEAKRRYVQPMFFLLLCVHVVCLNLITLPHATPCLPFSPCLLSNIVY